MKLNQWIILAGVVVGLVVGIGLLWPHRPVIAPTTNTANVNRATAQTNTAAQTTVFSTADLPDRDSHYSFTLDLPSPWVAEYVPGSLAINLIYPPDPTAGTPLFRSKVFVQYYQASDWQPPSYGSDPRITTIAGLSARQYKYEVPPTVKLALIPSFPAWVVISTHQVIHLRTGAQAPYTFLVFHQAPDLSDTTFSDIVHSIKINS